MGYRSEVKSIIYGDATKVEDFLRDNAETFNQLKEDFPTELSRFTRDTRLFIYLDCNYSKWYDEYEDVQRWHDFIEKAAEAGLCTEFVRIGEASDGDIEQMYRGEKNLNFLTPRVTIDVGFNY